MKEENLEELERKVGEQINKLGLESSFRFPQGCRFMPYCMGAMQDSLKTGRYQRKYKMICKSNASPKGCTGYSYRMTRLYRRMKRRRWH